MSYRAPVSDMLATMRHVAGLDRLIADGLAPELEGGVTEAVLKRRAIMRAQPESRLASGRRFSSCAMVQAFRMRQSE